MRPKGNKVKISHEFSISHLKSVFYHVDENWRHSITAGSTLMPLEYVIKEITPFKMVKVTLHSMTPEIQDGRQNIS